ncbi:MAG TPA: hypothetical protein VGP65_17525, partial [Candidatus Angelobacter sp.]|nr:hypothetical protein [Candidatus Angelobacter sp.]
ARESNFGATDLQKFLQDKGLRAVTKADLENLARAEEKQAQKLGALWFKFAEDNAMLAAIESEKTKAVSV